MAAAVTSAPNPTGLVRRSSIPVHAAVDVPAAVTPRSCILPDVDHVLHAAINGSLSDVAKPQTRAQAVPKHQERKMVLATTRNDHLEGVRR
jgi:hypothetical protein